MSQDEQQIPKPHILFYSNMCKYCKKFVHRLNSVLEIDNAVEKVCIDTIP